MKTIQPSELIINSDGSIFHLHLKPEEIADTVIMVGDPKRVDLISSFFDKKEFTRKSREFVSVTGEYKGKRLTIISTGIGSDNIDIVMIELDALVNIDFNTRQVKKQKRSLTILRIGTSGAIQPEIGIGTALFSKYSIGIDGLLNWYKGRDSVCDIEFEKALVEHMDFDPKWATPYVVQADEKLTELFRDTTVMGATLCSPGFYAPQGRELRIPISMPDLTERFISFEHNGIKLTNYEMEGAAIMGMAKLMGHRAATICLIINNRFLKSMETDYNRFVEKLIVMSLDKLSQ